MTNSINQAAEKLHHTASKMSVFSTNFDKIGANLERFSKLPLNVQDKLLEAVETINQELPDFIFKNSEYHETERASLAGPSQGEYEFNDADFSEWMYEEKKVDGKYQRTYKSGEAVDALVRELQKEQV